MTSRRQGILLALTLLAAASAAPAQQAVVRVIAMPGPTADSTAGDNLGLPVDERLLEKWRAARDRALREGANVLILEVTTPGGALLTAEAMVQDLKLLQQDGVRTAAFIPHAATSAGAIVALACREIVMGPDGSIGNVIPLEMTFPGQFREAPAKIKTEVVATMRQLSGGSGWPALLLAGMADEELDLIALKDTSTGEVEILERSDFERRARSGLPPGVRDRNIVPPGTAVKLSEDDVRYLKLPAAFCQERSQLLRALGLADRALLSEEVIAIERPKAGFFGPLDLRWEGVLGAILLLLGITFTVMEFKTPGLGLFGALAVICFLGFFLMQADSTGNVAITTTLLLIGFFLLLAEIIIIPGFGVAGVSGMVLIVASLYVAGVQPQGDTLWQQIFPDSDMEWAATRTFTIQLLGSLLLGIAGALFIARNLQHIPMLNKTLLMPPILEPATSRNPARTKQASTPHGTVTLDRGAIGMAETDLRPSGRVRFQQGPVDVVADGEFILKGTRVRVELVRGNRVVVAPFGDDA